MTTATEISFTRNAEVIPDDERYGRYTVVNCPSHTDMYQNEEEHCGNAVLFENAWEMFELLRTYEYTDSAVYGLLSKMREGVR